MDTSREDVGIAIRSAFLRRGTQQRFSLFALVVLAVVFLFVETLDNKPLNYLRSLIKDSIYRGSLIISSPSKGIDYLFVKIESHVKDDVSKGAKILTGGRRHKLLETFFDNLVGLLQKLLLKRLFFRYFLE